MERIMSQNCPAASPRAASRLRETVTTEAWEVRTASARIAGDGYCAVPRKRRDGSSVPETVSISAPLHRRQDLDPVALREPACRSLPLGAGIAVASGGEPGSLLFQLCGGGAIGRTSRRERGCQYV